MNTVYSFYVFTLFVAAAISILVGIMAWKRRNSRGAVSLVVLMTALFLWCFFQGLTFVESGLTLKLIMANMRYFGIELAPISFYALAYAYKNRRNDLELKAWIKLLAFPLFNLVALWTNPMHYKFYLKVGIEHQILYLQNGLLFWINMAYLYVFILAGVYTFITECIRSSSLYRIQAVIIAVAALIPMVSNLAFNFELLPFKNIDITPFSFLISGILYFYALFHYKLLDIVPVARDRVIEEMEDIVIVIDNNKRVLDMNKKARDTILDNSNKDYIGKEITSILAHWRELADVIIKPTTKNIKINFIRNFKNEYYDLRVSNLYNDKGIKNGELIVLVDITDLEEALQEAKNATEQAEYANRAKGYFLANMSHEIRTPLNAVLGIAEILDTTDLSRDKQKQYIKILTNSAESLLTIINDILDFSKIDSGKMEVEKNAFDIKRVVRDTVEIYSVLAENKHLKLCTKIDENINGFLLGDAVRIKQIIVNLLGNAIKFTEEGEIIVGIEMIKSEASNITIAIKVTDTGIGIAKEKIESIFESFKQADNSTARRFGGTGLGLSIVKSLVELMGGNIIVESELKKYTTFTCIIPFEVTDIDLYSENELEVDKDEKKELPGLRILVAEDNKINRQIIDAYLRKLSCRAEYAENGLQAIEKVNENDYDIVLMDIQMPEMDGLEAAKIIRKSENERRRHIPIIALTAGVTKEDIDNCYEAGMDAYLSKPVKVDSLYKALKALII